MSQNLSICSPNMNKIVKFVSIVSKKFEISCNKRNKTRKYNQKLLNKKDKL